MIEERKEEGNGSSNNTKVVGDSASVKKTLTSTLNESDDNILFTNNRMTDKSITPSELDSSFLSLTLDQTTTPNDECDRLRSTISGLKEEIDSWQKAYHNLQTKHTNRIETLIAEFNSRETRLKQKYEEQRAIMLKENTKSNFLMEDEIRNVIACLKSSDIDEILSGLQQVNEDTPSNSAFTKIMIDLKADLSNLLVQLRSERNSLGQDNEKLQRMVGSEKEKLLVEINNFKQIQHEKFEQVLNEKNKEIDKLKDIEKELVEKREKLSDEVESRDQQIDLLSHQVEKLKEEKKAFEQRMKLYADHSATEQNLVQDYKTQIHTLNKQIADNELKYVKLKNELETVVQNLEEQLRSDSISREHEQNQYRNTILKLQNQLENSINIENEYRISFEEQLKTLSNRLRESDEQKEKLAQQNQREKNELSLKIDLLTTSLEDKQSRNSVLEDQVNSHVLKIEELSLEVNKLHAIIEHKNTENNMLRENYEQEMLKFESDLKIHNDNLKKQIESLTNNHHNSADYAEHLKRKIQVLQQQLDTSTSTNKFLDETTKKLLEERNRLRADVEQMAQVLSQSGKNVSEYERQLEIERVTSAERIDTLTRKYKSMKEKYFKLSIRQNELQNYLLKHKKKKGEGNSVRESVGSKYVENTIPEYTTNGGYDYQAPISDAASQTSYLQANQGPSQSASTSPGSQSSITLQTNRLAQQIREYEELQQRYEKQRRLMELNKENFDSYSTTKPVMYHTATEPMLVGRSSTDTTIQEPKRSYQPVQPIQQLSVTSRGSNEQVQEASVGDYQRPRSAGKKLRKKKSTRPSSKGSPTSSRRHSLGSGVSFAKSKRS